MHRAALARIIFYYLAPIGIGLYAICLGMFIWRKEWRKEYPFFFSYVLFEGLSSALLHVLSFQTNTLHTVSYRTYFYIYWVQSALADIFVLAVFRELFLAAFKPFIGLRDMGRLVFRWAAIALILIGSAVLISSSLPSAERVELVVANLERAISIMQCAMLLFLFMASSHLSLPRSSHVFGLSLGFGVLAIANLILYIAMALTGYMHTIRIAALQLTPTIAFAIAPAIWVVYAIWAEPVREVVDVPISSPLLRWNEIATAFGHSGGRVAFMEHPEPFMPEAKRFIPDVTKEAYSRAREVQRTS
jgi:uncharacterized protein with PQ loop repeat